MAVGDNGSRNNEPGYETEPPEVEKKLTVYYGDGRTQEFSGVQGELVSGDFNGDGRDDLASGGPANYERETAPIRMFWGERDGLRAGDEIPECAAGCR